MMTEALRYSVILLITGKKQEKNQASGEIIVPHTFMHLSKTPIIKL